VRGSNALKVSYNDISNVLLLKRSSPYCISYNKFDSIGFKTVERESRIDYNLVRFKKINKADQSLCEIKYPVNKKIKFGDDSDCKENKNPNSDSNNSNTSNKFSLSLDTTSIAMDSSGNNDDIGDNKSYEVKEILPVKLEKEVKRCNESPKKAKESEIASRSSQRAKKSPQHLDIYDHQKSPASNPIVVKSHGNILASAPKSSSKIEHSREASSSNNSNKKRRLHDLVENSDRNDDSDEENRKKIPDLEENNSDQVRRPPIRRPPTKKEDEDCFDQESALEIKTNNKSKIIFFYVYFTLNKQDYRKIADQERVRGIILKITTWRMTTKVSIN